MWGNVVLEPQSGRYDLRRDIQFNTRVVSTCFDDDSGDWRVATDEGSTTRCQHLVLAFGCLSSFNMPKFDGIERFKGAGYHTGQWPKEGVDFSGQSVCDRDVRPASVIV